MNIQEVDKSIKQMRQMFGFFGVVFALLAVLMLPSVGNQSSSIIWLLIYGALAFLLFKGFDAAKARNPSGYNYVKLCSIIFVILIPVLTIFGISYLNKLSKPEVKQAFGILEG